MKTATLTLKRKVLVIELPKDGYYETYKDGTEIRDFLTDEVFVTSYTLLGKPDEIKEEDVAKFVNQSIHTNLFAHYVKDIPVNTYCYKTALESFNSALEKEILWVNLFNEKPSKDNIKFNQQMAEFEKAETRTFDRTRTLIFVEN